MRGFNIKFFIWATLLFTTALPANAQSWREGYLAARKAGEISICAAYVTYTNASFMTRIFGEHLDFMFKRDDFTLPYDKALGLVSFSFRDIDFVLAAITFPRAENDNLNTTSLLNLIPKKEDYAQLFDALRQNSRFTIEFPNGDSYPVTLQGSSRALNTASRCWENEQTGPLENNPFNGGESGVNPFSTGDGGHNPFGGT